MKETLGPQIEHESAPRDVSVEFLNLPSHEFHEFLRTLRREPTLTITIDWIDESTALKLKAFIEGTDLRFKQKRSATIRATEEQYKKAPNAFMSGVKWEKV